MPDFIFTKLCSCIQYLITFLLVYNQLKYLTLWIFRSLRIWPGERKQQLVQFFTLLFQVSSQQVSSQTIFISLYCHLCIFYPFRCVVREGVTGAWHLWTSIFATAILGSKSWKSSQISTIFCSINLYIETSDAPMFEKMVSLTLVTL